jgi:hypothetical protein
VVRMLGDFGHIAEPFEPQMSPTDAGPRAARRRHSELVCMNNECSINQARRFWGRSCEICGVAPCSLYYTVAPGALERRESGSSGFLLIFAPGWPGRFPERGEVRIQEEKTRFAL